MKKIFAFLLAMMLLTVFCFTCLAETPAAPAQPTAPLVDLTSLVVAIVVLIFEGLMAWLLHAIIPPAKKWLDSHTSKNQQTVIWNVVKRMVEAAEQIITGEGKGDEKLAWVEAQLRHYGYGFDRYVIEAAVKEMNDRSLAVIAEELDIPGEKQEKTEDE
ncbi:MAG: hypothetical protein IKF99_12095 [Oscillospiraceae bacterium]|nr:hypothetical protein [Oscillospiraceae bacterium]